MREAVLSVRRRLGDHEENMLVAQSNLSLTYHELERFEEANRMLRDVYNGYLKLHGEGSRETHLAALNYAVNLRGLGRFKETKSLLRKTMPVARRVLGDSSETTLRLRCTYARVLYRTDGPTLDDLHEAVTTLEDLERTARRVLGGAHPLTTDIERALQNARATLGARETLAGAMPATTLGDA